MYFQSVKLCHKQLHDIKYKNQKYNIFPTRNLPFDWLIWYGDYNKKIQNHDYAYKCSIQSEKYLQDSTRNNDQGFIKFA